ncbi:MAG: J domain-containing protein, partial [Methanomicrobium sp.]|nr:J domain-containing protein [Methanomicrobium sp.]
IKKVHPDVSKKSPAVSNEKTLRLNKAYSVLFAYCMNYSFSFAQKDILESMKLSKISYEEFWKERFGDDPIWG